MAKDLPSTSNLNELNRLLFAVQRLSSASDAAPIRSVMALCASVSLGGRVADHERILRLSQTAGLAAVSEGTAALTQLGQEFLACNPEQQYEINEAQRQFIANRLFIHGAWKPQSRDFFLNFSPDYSRLTYVLDLSEDPLPPRFQAIVHLMKELGVVVEDQRGLLVHPMYVAGINQLLSDQHTITQSRLEEALIENRKLGAQAEEAVLEYERLRLMGLGKQIEAKLVRRISQLNAGAGYDIESYNGNKPIFDYDRFIEVKATGGNELRFYWTSNEYRVAKAKGDQYWLYILVNFRPGPATDLVPFMIQNPVARIPAISALRMEVATYLIIQESELSPTPVNEAGLKGLVL